MGLELEFTDGQTPLDEDEKSDLRIGFITNRGELDEYEQQNIEIAIQWIMESSFCQPPKSDYLRASCP